MMALVSCFFPRSRYFQRLLRSPWSLAIIARSSSTVVKTSGDSKVLPFSNIPGPKGTIQNVLEYVLNKGSRLDLVKKRFEIFGPIYSEQVLDTQFVNISDADAVAKVLHTEKKFQMRPGFDTFNEIMDRNKGLMLLSNDYEKWYPERSLLSSKMLRPKDINETFPMLNTVANDFVKQLNLRTTQCDGKVENIEEELTFYSVEAFASYMFDQRLGFYNHPPDPTTVAFVDAARNMANSVTELAVNSPFDKYIKTPAYYRAEKNVTTCCTIGMNIVDKVLATNQEQEKDSGQKESLFDYASKNMAKISGLLAGAVDTTSTTSIWLLYLLSQHPDIQDKLYQELITAVGPDGEVSASNLPSLLKAALKESQRMYPVAGYAVLRVFDRDLDVLGYHIPSGVNIVMHEYVMSLDKRYCGENAKEFVPERWLRDETGERQELNAFVSLPFGYGTRMCIGRRIAESMIYILISKILLSYRLEYAGEDEVNCCPKETLIKPDRPVLIKFIPRQ